MCSECVVLLSRNYQFRQTCLQTDETLRSCVSVMECNAGNDTAAEELIIITNDSENYESTTKPGAEKRNEPKKMMRLLPKKRFLFSSSNEFQCGLCYKVFFKKDHLITHLSTHKRDKPYQCDVCHKKFNYERNLHKHQIIHKEGKEYICETCGKGECCSKTMILIYF